MEYTKELHEFWDNVLSKATGFTVLNNVDADSIKPLLSEITRLQSLTQWVGVEDRLPIMFISVILLTENGIVGEGKLSMIDIDTGTPCFDWENGLTATNVTHWMPLPEGVK